MEQNLKSPWLKWSESQRKFNQEKKAYKSLKILKELINACHSNTNNEPSLSVYQKALDQAEKFLNSE